jgi:hypothetical protein
MIAPLKTSAKAFLRNGENETFASSARFCQVLGENEPTRAL